MQERCSSAASARTRRRAKARLSTRWSIPETCTSSTPRLPSASWDPMTTEHDAGRELPFTGRTPWPRRLDTPLRTFLRTETGTAGMLLLATAAALVCPSSSPRDRRLEDRTEAWPVDLVDERVASAGAGRR